ncbi:hypothetical protein ANCCAN_08964 [Ancylostoma caninum]|uniref:Uncharacterized protein n=1 Tax=Ancylostoma caninum TaxID=29170 RepID=A0A368GKX2_ANCCA|nr:hypothetical protein ANCCAN_08964 [Ancylostoma caninum]
MISPLTSTEQDTTISPFFQFCRALSVHRSKTTTGNLSTNGDERIEEEDCHLEPDECMPSVSYERLVSGECPLEEINLKPFEYLMYGEEEDDSQEKDHLSHAKRGLESNSEETDQSLSPMCYVKRIKHEDEVTA